MDGNSQGSHAIGWPRQSRAEKWRVDLLGEGTSGVGGRIRLGPLSFCCLSRLTFVAMWMFL